MKRIMRAVCVLLLLLLVEILISERRQEAAIQEMKSEALSEATAEVEEEPEETVRIPEIVPVREEVVLPTAYDYRTEGRAPKVKNQEERNNCWAYAGISALESSLLPEMKKVYSTAHMTNQNGYAVNEEMGGAYIMAVSYLTAWKGPRLEGSDMTEEDLSTEAMPDVQVLDVRMPDYKDYRAIKQTVLLHGGVESSIYMDFMEQQDRSESYNPDTYSYCYMGETEPNHDVVIVGWDDTYPAENFKVIPEGDGAFLCLNSWGENFGDGGIFYVSYYDSNIGGTNTAYIRVEETGYFDDLYQSDLCGWTAQMGYAAEDGWFANVFTAKEQETLEAVGFYTTGMESTYEVYVVPELAEGKSLNDRVFVTNGYLQYTGYHTIEFPEDLQETVREALVLEAGQRFAVVVHVTTEDAMYPIAVEHKKEDQILEGIDLTDGESYISSMGTIWSNAEAECAGNVCLKAYVNR